MTYTVELADLMEHEKVIEQGLAAFVDVGCALIAIKANRKYVAAGYSTFEEYLLQRWNMSSSHGYRLVLAASIADTIDRELGALSPIGDTLRPRYEAQVRELAPLRDDPAAVTEAWVAAVKHADGDQPTAEEVRAIVDARRGPPASRTHPAPYSDAILDTIAAQLVELGPPAVVVDPFAGTGRVHRLRDLAGITTTIGIELEAEWARQHPDTHHGNALNLAAELTALDVHRVDAIVTSPTYGNRMADRHNATDDSVRHTYTHTLGRPLHDANSGALQWGPEYRTFHVSAWCEAVDVLAPGGLFTLNVKDHVRDGRVQRVAAWHLDTLAELGLHLVALDMVPTRGLAGGAGANGTARVTGELVATLRKPGAL